MKTMPPCVLINERYDILYFYGNTDRFLMPPTGEASFNIVKMARDGMRYKLTIALHKAVKQKKEIGVEGLKIRYNDDYINYDLIIRPIM